MKSFPKLLAHPEQPAGLRILEGLRSQIMTGKLAPGTQLPSARSLAVTWRSNAFTVHTALSTLAKEGWLNRRHGSGTYIADPKTRFICAGIYHDAGIGYSNQRAFQRYLHFSLLNGFERLKKSTEVFMDPRPSHEQTKLLPALDEAIRDRRIQCLIALSMNTYNERSLTHVPIVSAFSENTLTPRWAAYDMEAMLLDGARKLAEQGCRSIGLISNLGDLRHVTERVIREHGMILHKYWEEKATFPEVTELEAYGYREFRKIWSQRRKPDGLLVFPDIAVHGVILSILETGVRDVTRAMKFVFHCNAHIPVACPFPVTWAVADEDALANAFIELIQKQFRNEKVTPTLVPFTFKNEVTLK